MLWFNKSEPVFLFYLITKEQDANSAVSLKKLNLTKAQKDLLEIVKSTVKSDPEANKLTIKISPNGSKDISVSFLKEGVSSILSFTYLKGGFDLFDDYGNPPKNIQEYLELYLKDFS